MSYVRSSRLTHWWHDIDTAITCCVPVVFIRGPIAHTAVCSTNSVALSSSLLGFILYHIPLKADTMGLMLKKPAGEPGSAVPAIIIGLFVAFGGILFG
jgi:hypothetical protein